METIKHSDKALKKAMKLLLSVSAFSVIMFSYSSLLVPFLVNCLYDAYFSVLHKQSSGSALQKNCVFLLCNGLLVIIFKNSSLAPVEDKSPQPLDTKEATPMRNPVSLKRVVSEEEEQEQEQELAIVEMDEQEKSGSGSLVVKYCDSKQEEEEEQEQELAIVKMVEQEKSGNGCAAIEYCDNKGGGGEGKEEEAIAKLKAEEFNKICEDFIRKVKEEIKREGLKYFN